jgi:hypothetical protein
VKDYAAWVGYYLNIDRLGMRRTMEVAAGIAVAFADRVDPAYFEAICDTDAEGQEMAYETNAARQMARIRAKYGA